MPSLPSITLRRTLDSNLVFQEARPLPQGTTRAPYRLPRDAQRIGRLNTILDAPRVRNLAQGS